MFGPFVTVVSFLTAVALGLLAFGVDRTRGLTAVDTAFVLAVVVFLALLVRALGEQIHASADDDHRHNRPAAEPNRASHDEPGRTP